MLSFHQLILVVVTIFDVHAPFLAIAVDAAPVDSLGRRLSYHMQSAAAGAIRPSHQHRCHWPIK